MAALLKPDSLPDALWPALRAVASVRVTSSIAGLAWAGAEAVAELVSLGWLDVWQGHPDGPAVCLSAWGAEALGLAICERGDDTDGDPRQFYGYPSDIGDVVVRAASSRIEALSHPDLLICPRPGPDLEAEINEAGKTLAGGLGGSAYTQIRAGSVRRKAEPVVQVLADPFDPAKCIRILGNHFIERDRRAGVVATPKRAPAKRRKKAKKTARKRRAEQTA